MHQFTITHWHNELAYGTIDSRDLNDNDPIESEYITKLFEYREMLGVMSVKKDNKVITWQLNSCWYSSEEIDRMLKLKVFA